MNDPIVFTIVMFGHALIISIVISYVASKFVPAPKDPVSEMFNDNLDNILGSTMTREIGMWGESLKMDIKPMKFKTQAQILREKQMQNEPKMPTPEEMEIEFKKTIK